MRSPRILLKAWDIHAKKQFGQNFLSDPSTAQMIVQRSGIKDSDTVLEIGAGLGALTLPLAGIAKKVYAVEKDRQIVPILKTEIIAAGLSNVEIIHENILDFNLTDIAQKADGQIFVIGNLPYNISSQVLIKLIKHRQFVKQAVFMFQKELAQRIVTPPGSKDYGRLSVCLQYCAEIETIAEIKSNLFFPRPKVDSLVIKINFKDSIKHNAHDEEFFFKVIKAAFGQRRKTLKNSLAGSELNINPEQAIDALKNAGIDPMRRAETLSVEEFVNLSNILGS